jgi:hypothetical protein
MTLKKMVAWIRGDWERTKDDVYRVLPWVIGTFLWLLAGLILTIFYGFLSGGIPGEILGTYSMFVSPAIVLFLVFLFVGWREEEAPWMGKTFWLFLTWAFLPVILNGASIVLKWVGARGVGEIIFKARFASLWVTPIASAIIAGLVYWRIYVRNKRRKETVLA